MNFYRNGFLFIDSILNSSQFRVSPDLRIRSRHAPLRRVLAEVPAGALPVTGPWRSAELGLGTVAAVEKVLSARSQGMAGLGESVIGAETDFQQRSRLVGFFS